jgi:hypothetical protein
MKTYKLKVGKRKNKSKGKKRIGGGKTLKNVCSPHSNIHKINPETCLTPDAIKKIKTNYNEKNPKSAITIDNPQNVFKSLKQKLKCSAKLDSTSTTDLCWIKNIDNPNLQKEIKKKIFIPEKPTEWKKNPTEWLSNFDIMDVLKQYEEAYPYFRFIGPSPIDFDKNISGSCVNRDLCLFKINPTDSKQQIGIIFNLDKHDEPGSHWVSMYIDIGDKHIYYFDSASTSVPNEIGAFKDRLIKENPDFSFVSNDIEHQKGNTECGMYSLYFIIKMLLSKSRRALYNSHFNNGKNRITDKMVEDYRNVYFQ